MIEALNQYCTAQQPNSQWKNLLDVENPQSTENMSWNSFIGPILTFKLITVLSGTSSHEGKTPQSAMSKGMAEKLIKLVRFQLLFMTVILKPCRPRWLQKGMVGPAFLKMQLEHFGILLHNLLVVQWQWNIQSRKPFLRRLPHLWFKI